MKNKIILEIIVAFCLLSTGCARDTDNDTNLQEESCINTEKTEEEQINSELSGGKRLSDFSDQIVNIGYVDFLIDYEGYLDNVKILEEEYANQDYDLDGKIDRILQYYLDNGNKIYAICFGNGNLLEIGPFEDSFTGIEVYAADLTGNGKNEIIFFGQHTGSTYPEEGSEIAIWTYEKNKYKKVKVTDTKDSNSYEVGYPIYIEKTNEDYEVLISCTELNLEKKYKIPEDEREEFDSYYVNLQKGEKILVNERAWSISIEEGEKTVLWLNEAALYRLPGTVKIKLEWNDNKFEATDVQFVIK